MTLSVFPIVIIHDPVIVVSFAAAVWAHASHSLPKRRAQMMAAEETILSLVRVIIITLALQCYIENCTI